MQELTRRRFLVSAGAAGAGLVLGACGSTKEPSLRALATQGRLAATGGVRYDGPPVELQFWNGFTGGDGPFMRAFADSFNKEQDKVRVRMNVILWADFYQKTTAAVASGTGPDVGVMQLDQLPTAAAHRIVVPLDEVAQAMKLDESDFPPAVWRAGVIGGRRYGIPLDVHPLGMYVNESVLKDAGLDPKRDPTTKAEYLADLAKLKAKGIAGAWVSPFLFTGSLQYQSLIAQFGGSLYDAQARRATWDSDAGVEALTFMRDLVKKGYSSKNVGQDADAIAFKNGQNAFLWNGPWAINEYAGIPDLKWHAAPVPRIGSQRGVWANSHQFVLFRQPHGDDNRLQAATSFIDYVSRRSQKWAEAGMVPARKTAREDPAFKKLKAQSIFAKELPYVRFTPPVPGIDVVRALTLDPAIQSAVLLQQEPKAALQDAATRANALLADNRQKYGI